MPAPGTSTWDGNANASPPVTNAYRPGASDFNGAALQDDAVNPPNPATMPTSAQQNTIGLLLVSIGKLIPNATISINGGAPPTVQYQYYAMNNSTPALTITRVGAGNVQLTWPANTFPAPVAFPKAHLSTGGTAGFIEAVAISNGVQVRTYNSSGTLTDMSFVVDVM